MNIDYSNKKQKNQAFLASIAMLLVSVLLITTASFAWFTLGKNVAVEEIDLKVTASEGIVISANNESDMETWTNMLSFEDLDGTSENPWKAPSSTTNNFPAVINPASSSFAAGSLPSFFEGGIDANASGAITMVAAASVAENHTVGADKPGYYAFDIYIKYTGSDDEIKVNVGQSVINVKKDVIANEEDKTNKNNQPVVDALLNVTKSMRIGFVNYQDNSENVMETLVYSASNKKELDEDGNPTFSMDENGNKILEVNDISGTKPVIASGESADLATRNSKGEITSQDSIVSSGKTGTLGLAETYEATIDAAGSADNAVLTLKKGINHIRVYIWMEGQDVNCTDEMFSQLVGAQIVFKMV